MTASQVIEGSQLTIFTVAALKDTGFWADVNENLVGLSYWGKDKGCNFPILGCGGSFEEFSATGVKGCSFWNDGQGSSVVNTYSDDCSYITPDASMICKNSEIQLVPQNVTLNEYAFNSKCFESNIMEPALPGDPNAVPPVPDPPVSTSNTRCHVYSCSSDSSSITITSSYPSVKGFSLVCNLGEEGIAKPITNSTYTLGQITCPKNYKRFCSNKTCKNFCSFGGICVQGQCFCNPGRAGDDCSVPCPNFYDSGSCVQSCPVGRYANMDNVCRATCPAGFYQGNKVCSPCDYSCSTCTGSANNQCTACQLLTYLYKNTCVLTCPTGSYVDETTKSCIDCPYGCADCTSSTVCGSCLDSFLQSGTLCQALVCDSNCFTCVSTPTTCKSCSSGKYLNKATSTCDVSCPSGFFQDTTNNICSACSTGCTSCSSATVCTACDSTSGYRLSPGQFCTLCQAPCATCLSTNTAKCTSCEGSMILMSNTCYSTCPDYFYNFSSLQCQSCIGGCLKCSNGNTCTTCDTANGYQLYKVSNTISICITATACYSPCATCPTPYQPVTCGTCVASFKLQGTTCKSACDQGYKEINSVCTKTVLNAKVSSKGMRIVILALEIVIGIFMAF